MESPLPPDLQDFDLSSEARYVRRELRQARFFMTGIGGFLVLLGVWFVLPPYHQSTFVIWGVGLALWGLGVVFARIGVRMKRTPPMDRLTIRPGSVTVRYADGVESTVSWTDTTLGMALFDYSSDPGSIGVEKRHVWIALSSDRGGSVPQGVKEALVDAARRHNLPVLVRKEAILRGRGVHLAVVTRIGVPERTPGWKDAVLARS